MVSFLGCRRRKLSFYNSNDVLYVLVVFFEKSYYFFNSIVILFDERYNVILQVFEFFIQFRFRVGSDDMPSVLRFLFRVGDGDASSVLWISLNLLLRLLSVTGS